jgi:hypothetical protein
VLLGLLVASNALYFHFYFSQVQLLVGALLLGAYMLQRLHRYSTALALAVAAALLKLFPAALLPWFLITAPGSMRARGLRLVPATALALGTILLTWHLWSGFLHSGSTIVKDAIVNQTFNFSMPSLVVNLGWAHYAFAPTAAQASRIWLLANISGLLLVTLAYAVVCLTSTDPETGFCVLLLACTLASPTAWGHYFVLAFLPFSVLFATAVQALTPQRLLGISLAYVFVLDLASGVSLNAPLMWRIALAYCPLYAASGMAIWFASVRRGTDAQVTSR